MTSSQESTLFERDQREDTKSDTNDTLTKIPEHYRNVTANTLYPTTPWKWAALTVIFGGLVGLTIGFSVPTLETSSGPISPLLLAVFVGVTLTATVADWYWYYHRAPTSLRQRCTNSALPRGLFTFGITAVLLTLTAIGVAAGTILIVWLLTASFAIIALIMFGFMLAGLVSLLAKNVEWLAISIVGTFACFVVSAVLAPAASLTTEGLLHSRGLSSLLIGSLLLAGSFIPEYRASSELSSYIEPLREAVKEYDKLSERLDGANEKLPAAYQSSVALEPFDPLEYGSVTTASEDLEILASDISHIESYAAAYTQIDEQFSEEVLSENPTQPNGLQDCCRVLHPDRYQSTVATEAAIALFATVTARFSALYAVSEANTKEMIQEQSHPFFVELQKRRTEETLEHADVKVLETEFEAFEQELDGYEPYWELESWLNTLRPRYETTIESLTGSPLSIKAAEYHPADTEPDTIESALEQTVVLDSLCSVAEKTLRIESQYTSVTAERATDKLRQRISSVCSTESSVTVDDVEILLEIVKQIERCCVLAEQSTSIPMESLAVSITSWGTSEALNRQERETIMTLLTQCERITEFIDRVDHTHPTVEADAWTIAMQSAVRERSPTTLRPIVETIDQIGNRVWERSHLFDVDWKIFEELVGALYREQGYNIMVTQGTNDEGVDVWAQRGDERLAIQVKQYSNDSVVGRPDLQQIASTIAKGDATRAVVVTSSTFAHTAETYAADFGQAMTIIDGDELLRKFSESDIVPPS